jgi:dTDP-4-amino-4,6-dideoxygalactose transaminase
MDAGIRRRRWRREPLAVTEALASSTLGLPFWIDMGPDEIGRLAAALQDALSHP